MATNAIGRRPGGTYDDWQSSGSDEDRNPVEVVFDASNPYRRKSSMATSDSIPLHLRQVRANKTECFVHQFLENQRRARHRNTSPTGARPPQQLDGDGDVKSLDVQSLTLQTQDISKDTGLDSAGDPKGAAPGGREDVEMKGKNCRCSIIDGSSSEASNDIPSAGQIDEREWKEQITKTSSQLDLHASAAAQEMQSRLLTKKQLSEMAWGVRELSRRLGSIRLRFRVKTIFLLTKIYDQDLIMKTREITRWLLDKERDVRYTVYIERELKDNKKFDAAGLVDEVRRDFVAAGETSEEASGDIAKRLRYWDEDMCRARPHTFDFVITLGGDGTVLYASWLFQRIVPPVLSFALGSLGFLTKFDFEEYQQILDSAFTDGVTVSLRLRFEATIMRSQEKRRRVQQQITDGQKDAKEDEEDEENDLESQRDLVEELIGEEKDDEHTHHPDGTYEVLNEVVVDRGPNPTMSNIEIFGDDEHFTSVSADGVCVSTPTGSTAYNLAAGGSLCHPENPVMLVTSVCAHTLSFRPIILPDTIVLRLGVPYDARTSSWASFDGRERIELGPGDYVTISASRYPFACVQAQGRRSEDWIKSISAKLGWNTRQKQKAYKEWGK
ncbi:ATP-NAD kinase-like domain-containing protein [Podospora didyma]|uniref:ATP-NAD kinase-like domain-containing protein n=1 Tax=Podospora didyma TaxID=330526 RepID=A0AAE0NCA7_9PEZI|nr:ATP-NAD kinase-like domain-containing protein [Podospora didyma]